MKKLLAILLTLAVLCSLSVTAFAAEPGSSVNNPVMMSYQDFDTSVYDGVWVSTGLGFDVYLPEDWVLVEIAEEQAAQGLVFLAGEDGGGANMTIVCKALPEEVADSYDYEQLGQELAASNTTAMYADLNGIPAVIYENDETKVCGFCILPDDGSLISAAISAPTDDQYDEYSPYMENMILSVSPSATELLWEDVEDYAAELDPDAVFGQVDDYNLAMWVPSFLEGLELTDEEYEDGYIAYLMSEDASCSVAIWLWNNEDGDDLISLQQYFADEAGYDDAELTLINGIPALTYSDDEDDSMNVVMMASDEEFMQIWFSPISDEDYSEFVYLMISSLQTIA